MNAKIAEMLGFLPKVVVCFVLVGASAGAAAAGDEVVVTNTGMFEVSSPTTFSYVTNFWYNDNGYGLVSADVTVEGNSYLRIGKTMSTSDPEHGTYFATGADDDLTFTIGGNSGVYFTYRNSNGPVEWVNAGVDPDDQDQQPTYSHLRFGVKDGEKDSSGRMKFVLNSNPNAKFGNNINGLALWASYLHIESSLKAHASGYIDILELNNEDTTADIHYFCNHNANYPTRILFNGGKLRNNQACLNRDYGISQFLPDAGTKIVLEGVNGNDITINKAYFGAALANTLRRLNGGAGTLRFQGNCDVRLADTGNVNPVAGGSAGNRSPFILDPAFGPIEWKQTGELVLFSNGWLMPLADYMLPCDEDIQTIRLQGNASLDLNGYKLALRSLISDAKAAAYVTNMYANYKGTAANSLLVFGTNDIDGVFSANTCDHISVEKVGAGTLVVSNATIDVDKSGTAEFVVREGTVMLVGTNKLGADDLYESAKFVISNEATVIREEIVTVASGATTQASVYADDAKGVKVRLVKKGAGTLILDRVNTFTGGLVIDEGIVKVTAVGAQGPGKITVNCDATANREAQIRFATIPPNTTTKMIYTNDIHVTGSSFFGVNNKYHEKGAVCFAQTNQVLNGSIVADADLSIVDSKDGSLGGDAGKMQNADGGTITGAVTVAGDLHFNSGFKSYFNGSVTAANWWNRGRDGCRGYIYLGSTNTVGTYKLENRANCKLCSNVKDAFKGSKLEWIYADGSGASMRGCANITGGGETEVISVNGVDFLRTNELIDNDTKGYAMMTYNSSSATKMTIVGEEDTIAQYCGIVGNKPFTLELNAPDSYTQIFSNVLYLATAELKVSSGTMIIDGKSYFPNLTKITVEGDGVLDIRELGSVTNDTINCMPKIAEINVSSTATLKLAEGIAITSLVVKVDGYQLEAGEYAANPAMGINWLQGGGKVQAKTSPSSYTAKDAVWTGGAGEDHSTTSAANWENTPTPAFYYRGYRAIFGEGGSEAVFPAGLSYLKGIRFDRDGDFALSGADDTTSFKLDAAIEVIGTGHVYTVNAPVEQSVGATIKFPSNTKLVMEKGYQVGGNLTLCTTTATSDNGGEIEFREPVKVSGTICGSSSFKGKSPYLKVKFHAVGNEATTLDMGYVNVQFFVTNAFEGVPFNIGGGVTESEVDFNNTRQETPTFACKDTKGQLFGNYPATLAITNGWADRAEAVTKKFGPSTIGGWLKLEKSGDGYHIIGQASSAINYASYGDLEVSGGTLEILPTATWLNGTNFICRGTGTLVLADADTAQIGPQAKFQFADTGKVDIPAGITYTVSSITVGGEPVAAGLYDKDSTGLMAGRITGDGKLRVKTGMMFIFR